MISGGTLLPVQSLMSITGQSAGKVPAGKVPAGKVPAGKVPAGKVPAESCYHSLRLRPGNHLLYLPDQIQESLS
jgi:hypothetical protein